MKQFNTKKLTVSGIFCTVAVIGSLFSFPVFGSMCSPVQHMVNVLCGVLLGPFNGFWVAFAASLLRNLLSLGSLLAFPGSMFGALLCGITYHYTKNMIAAVLAEMFGTAVLGGLCAYPIAILFIGKAAAGTAFYAYIIPFLISTTVGSVCAAALLFGMQEAKLLDKMQNSLDQ